MTSKDEDFFPELYKTYRDGALIHPLGYFEPPFSDCVETTDMAKKHHYFHHLHISLQVHCFNNYHPFNAFILKEIHYSLWSWLARVENDVYPKNDVLFILRDCLSYLDTLQEMIDKQNMYSLSLSMFDRESGDEIVKSPLKDNKKNMREWKRDIVFVRQLYQEMADKITDLNCNSFICYSKNNVFTIIKNS